MARILVIDESQQRAVEICCGLIKAGHQVAAVLPSALEHLAVTRTQTRGGTPRSGRPALAADRPALVRRCAGWRRQVQTWRARLQPLLAESAAPRAARA